MQVEYCAVLALHSLTLKVYMTRETQSGRAPSVVKIVIEKYGAIMAASRTWLIV